MHKPHFPLNAKEITGYLNKLREEPKSYQHTLQVVAKAFKRAKKKKAYEELNNYANKLDEVESLEPVEFSPILSKACEAELKHMIKDEGLHYGIKSFDETKVLVNKYCAKFTNLQMIYDHGDISDTMIARYVVSDHDPDNLYEKAIRNPKMKYIGVATKEVGDENASVIILADDVVEVEEYKQELFDNYLDKLKASFDFFDVEKTGKLNFKILNTALKMLKFNIEHKELYQNVINYYKLKTKNNEADFNFERFAVLFNSACLLKVNQDDENVDELEKNQYEKLYKIFKRCNNNNDTIEVEYVNNMLVPVLKDFNSLNGNEVINVERFSQMNTEYVGIDKDAFLEGMKA